jgi:hypothetical protein
MKTILALALTAAVGAAAPAARADESFGPSGSGACARGPRGRGPRLYDPKTLTTVSGEVAAVQTRGRRGVGVELQTAEGTLSVHLGPSWFLEEQGLQIAAGDRLEITGSTVAFRGKPGLVAQVVKKGELAVALRDVQGVPVWAGPGCR